MKRVIVAGRSHAASVEYKIRQAGIEDLDVIVEIWMDGNIEQYRSAS